MFGFWTAVGLKLSRGKKNLILSLNSCADTCLIFTTAAFVLHVGKLRHLRHDWIVKLLYTYGKKFHRNSRLKTKEAARV